MDNTLLAALLDVSLLPQFRSCFRSTREYIERPAMRNAGVILRAAELTIAPVGRDYPAAELAWHLLATGATAVLFCRVGESFAFADAVSGKEDVPPVYPDLIEKTPIEIAPISDIAVHEAAAWLSRRLAPHRYAVLSVPAEETGADFYRTLRGAVDTLAEQVR